QPVAGAEVELRDRDNKVLWKGKTGADGTVSAPGWDSLGVARGSRWDAPDLYVFARSGSDRAFMGNNYNWMISPWVFDVSVDYYPTLPDYRAHAFTERGLYRAGEEVYLKGAIRELRTGKFLIPELKQLDYKLMDSRDQLVETGVVKVTDFGSFDHTVKIAAGAPTGYYSMYYYLPGEGRLSLKEDSNVSPVCYEGFRVEAFRPAQFEVKVETDKTSYVYGDKARASLAGRYLFGGAMKGDSVKWVARAEPLSFSPPGWEGFDFGPATWLDEEPAEEPKTLVSGEGALDDEGKQELEVDLSGLTYQGSAALVVEGTVTSASRQQISGRATVLAHPGAYLIGLRPKSSFNAAGSTVAVEVVTTDPEGKAQSGNKIALELVRRDWHSVRRVEGGGSYRWVTTVEDQKVADTSVDTAENPVLANLTPDKPGFYLVRATGKDAAGHLVTSVTTFYASGAEYVAWARGENDTIELVADKKGYKPGETARILVKSPYEKCTALVTVERELVMRRFVTELNGSAPTVEIPIKSEDLPNVFVSVMLISGRVSDGSFSDTGEDLGKPSFKVGYVDLPVDTGEKHLKVTVKSDREEYRPGDTVTLDLEVLDHQGKPVVAEVDLAVVDRGVLNLIQYETPDLFGPFYGPRPLRINTAETRVDVIGLRSYGTKGETDGGGGGAEGADLREDFKATAFWDARVITDKDGRQKVTFTLPDNLTSFRIMATAQTKGSSFGAGESEFKVNKPLQLLPSTPRFVRQNDEFQAGVLVHNHTQTAGTAQVSVQVTGLDATGPTSSSVYLGAGQEEEVLFKFVARPLAPAPRGAQAAPPGEATFSFHAQMGTQKDGLKLNLPVQLPVPTETVATTGSTEAAEAAEGLMLDSKPAPGVGGLTVTVSSTVLSGLSGAMEYIETYPYGCLEQRLTRIAPHVLLPELMKTWRGGTTPAEREAVQAALDQLGGFQAPSGGLMLWPSSTTVNDYLTVYALDILDRARKDGYKVDMAVYNGVRGYVKRIPSASDFDYPYSEPEKLIVRAYAVSVLAGVGVRDVASFDQLLDERRGAPLEAQVHLYRAASRLQADRAILKKLRDGLTSRIRVEADAAYFEEKDADTYYWVYGSNLRLTAQILGALLETDPQFQYAPQVVKWLLVKQRFGHWGSTADDITVLAALDLYQRTFEKADPNFEVEVQLGDLEVLSEVFRGRQARVVEKQVPATGLSSGKVPLVFRKDGPGRLYYTARLKYAPEGDVPPRDEGFCILKQVTPLEGSPSADPTLKAGQVYRVTLSVVTPQERHFVVLDDPIPGGVEVVQTSFATESDELRRALEHSALDHYWGGTFNHFEIHDDRVLLFADYLTAGEHKYEYLIRAGYPGTYDQPAAHAEEMYHPEVFGTTPKLRVDIR
ncbi:MAG: alpha-2-macroglobulin family protein, partial [Candidatus Eremiobacterota bacterium]